jgi:uncharacterized protein
MNSNKSRLIVVDALRGFAIISIMLLHNLEHFDFLYNPKNLPTWMYAVDKGVWDTVTFLFAGKSYAIFALLFGLTFFIQSNNQEKIGKDFRARFAWRLVLLLIFGMINSAFYEGDILSIYAVLGFFLLPVAKLSNKVVFWIALILLLQPYFLVKFLIALQNPLMQVAGSGAGPYFAKAGEYIPKSSIINTMIGNLTNGKMAVAIWSWENGRVFQNISLFMFGMLAGRKQLFLVSAESKRFWIRTLIIAAISFIILFIVSQNLPGWIDSRAIRRPARTMVNSWTNFSFMLVWLSGFTLLFQTSYFSRKLNFFSYLGRMSLSNYMMQSIMGAFIYYGFGLGLYKYTGSTYCLLIGIILAIIQFLFCYWWAKNHKQGPLETIWHKGTWIGRVTS